MNKDTICNTIALALTITQTERTFQLISLILTCISISISLIYRLIEIIKKIKNKNKISKGEIYNLIDEAKGTMTTIKNEIERYEKEQSNND